MDEKAPEDWRTPKRFAKTGVIRLCASFWTAAASAAFFSGGQAICSHSETKSPRAEFPKAPTLSSSIMPIRK